GERVGRGIAAHPEHRVVAEPVAVHILDRKLRLAHPATTADAHWSRVGGGVVEGEERVERGQHPITPREQEIARGQVERLGSIGCRVGAEHAAVVDREAVELGREMVELVDDDVVVWCASRSHSSLAVSWYGLYSTSQRKGEQRS